MIKPNFKKIISYAISLILILQGVLGVAETLNEKDIVDGFYLLMIMVGVTIQLFLLGTENGGSGK